MACVSSSADVTLQNVLGLATQHSSEFHAASIDCDPQLRSYARYWTGSAMLVCYRPLAHGAA